MQKAKNNKPKTCHSALQQEKFTSASTGPAKERRWQCFLAGGWTGIIPCRGDGAFHP